MKKFIPKKIFILSSALVFFAILISAGFFYFSYKNDINVVRAGTGDNTNGFAWSENIGWISFNSTNCDTNDNGFIDTDVMSQGCGGDDTSYVVFDYGVNVDTSTGDFSGYAWSSNVGWIGFTQADIEDLVTYPGCGFPAAPCNAANHNSGTGAVTGWAKIIILGDDGWIKMSDDSVGVWTGKGVSIDSATGDFFGWAWNENNAANTGIGWVSFNCLNDSSCGVSDYKVHAEVNSPPTPINLSAPNWNSNSACNLTAKQAILRWDFSDPDPGDTQDAYQIRINTVNNINTPIADSGKVVIGASQHATSTPLSYGTPYYWWVKVWDNNDLESAWVQYSTGPDTHNDDGNDLTYTTYLHEFPNVNFGWFPTKPSANEDATFSATSSEYYKTTLPTISELCDEVTCSWEWDPSDTLLGKATINDKNASTTIINFNSEGWHTVPLRVTDSDGYFCEDSQPVGINVSLPTWEEVTTN